MDSSQENDMLKSVRRASIFISIVLVIMILMTVTADASSIKNNGKFKDNPYGKSDVKPTLKGVDYYDCYLPYKQTFNELGGYCIGGHSSGHYKATPMSESARKSIIGGANAFLYEFNGFAKYSQETLNNYFGGSHKQEFDPDTDLAIVKDANGNKYYVAALMKFYVNNEGAYTPYGGVRGYIFDIVLADGTCLHFTVGDTGGEGHIIGGPETNQDSVTYKKAPLKKKQYYGIGHCQTGHSFELWGKNANSYLKLIKKYNISESNPVVAVRMYNAKVGDNPKRNVSKDVMHKISGINLVGGNDSSSSEGGRGENIPKESELTGMPKGYSISEYAEKIELSDGTDLSTGEQYSASIIRDNLKAEEEANFNERIRISIVFVGFLLMGYALLFLLSVVFDRTNSFLETPMVKIITAGKLRYTHEEYGGQNEISFKQGIKISLAIFLIGILIVSEGIFIMIQKLVLFILGLFR